MLTDEFFLGTKLYSKKLYNIFEPIKNYLGLNHVIYINIDKQGGAFSICTHDKWTERFLEEQYYQLDPLMVHPNNIHNGFAFDNASDYQEFQDKLLYEAVTHFNCCHTFAYIEKTATGGYFGFCFASPKENFGVINRVLNESHIIKKFIKELHRKLELIINKNLQDNKMDFARLKGDPFYHQKGIVFNDDYKNQLKVRLLQGADFLTNNDNLDLLTRVSLSPQEINCLRVYITTRSIKTISKELKLATSTVSSYIENIKDKLQCNYKNELLEKAEILESLGRL